jgi:hypothetical protein
LHEGPRKDPWLCNVVPRDGRPARVAGIRRARRRSRPGEDGEGSRELLGPVWALGRGVSVRNMVPTLTSRERQGLSLHGRC